MKTNNLEAIDLLHFAIVCGLLLAIVLLIIGIVTRPAHAFGPVPKKDQCISVNALLQRNCAPVYMCDGPKDTNASWCCSARWVDEETKLLQWYKRNCER